MNSDKEPNDIYITWKQLVRESRIKHCIYPITEECSETIIKAHSIQRNRYLSQIAERGEVYMILPHIGEIFTVKAEKVGIKAATVFTGFCGYHDNKIFEPIEIEPYKNTPLQNFLFAYRAFAFTYHRKLEAVHLALGHIQKKPDIVNQTMVQLQIEGYRLAIRDITYVKEKFDASFCDSDKEINTFVLEIPRECYIAACGSFFLEYDLQGKILVDLEGISFDLIPQNLIFLNIFSQAGKTYALMSWWDNPFFDYKAFMSQVEKLSESKKINFINNLATMYCENTAISPILWERLSKSRKEKYYNIFQESANGLRHKDRLLASPVIDFFKD